MPDLQQPSHPDRYSAAQQRARVKLDFYRHLVTYVIVITALAILNFVLTPDYLWFLWPAVGWGVGLIAHATNVFAFSDAALKRLTERELRRQE